MPRPAAVIAALALTAPALALADAKTEARTRLEHATELHGQGKFNDALVELTTAYSLDPRPEILYAIAQTHVALGDCTQAIMFYERFLSTHPAATPAAAAQEAIDACKTGATPPPQPQVLDTLPAPEQSAPPPPPPPVVESPAPWYRDWIGDALVGGGVVAGAIALVTYRSAVGDLDRADDAEDYARHGELVDRAHGKRTIAAVLAVAGVGLIGAGVARFVLTRRAEHVAIAPVAGGAIVGWAGRF